jgi:hypothetical protein
LLIFTSITTIQQQVYASKEDKEDDDNENDKDKKFDPKKAAYRTWEGKILNHDEMTERIKNV